MNLLGRSTFIVTYDVADPKRLAKVYKVMRGYGDHLQLSVFRCELTARELVDLRSMLGEVVNAVEDQVLLFDLGPADGRGGESVSALGRPFGRANRQVVVF